MKCVAHHYKGWVVGQCDDESLHVIKSGFMPVDTRTDKEKLIDEIADLIRESKELHLTPVNEARHLIANLNVKSKDVS